MYRYTVPALLAASWLCAAGAHERYTDPDAINKYLEYDAAYKAQRVLDDEDIEKLRRHLHSKEVRAYVQWMCQQPQPARAKLGNSFYNSDHIAASCAFDLENPQDDAQAPDTPFVWVWWYETRSPAEVRRQVLDTTRPDPQGREKYERYINSNPVERKYAEYVCSLSDPADRASVANEYLHQSRILIACAFDDAHPADPKLAWQATVLTWRPNSRQGGVGAP